MTPERYLLPGLLAYAVVGRGVLALPLPWRSRVFAILNVVAAAVLFYGGIGPHTWALAVQLGVVVASWALMRAFARRPGRIAWLPFFFPVTLLAVTKFVPLPWSLTWRAPDGASGSSGLLFVGLSYIAFRLSHLSLEVRNRIVEPPSLSHYVGFAFFVPTIPLGPISPFLEYDASFRSPSRQATPLGRALSRFVVGAAKYGLLGAALHPLTYDALVLDGRPHSALDWVVSAVAYYGFLYANFSGFSDIAIGVAGMLRIRVPENFDNPFGARNVQIFWTRWHMTLGAYMRNVLFTPLSKWLVMRLGPKRRDHAIAFAIFIVFVVTGVWHGPSFNYLAFGLLNGAALAATHYYGIALKRRLGRDRYERYLESTFVRTLTTAGTFVYVVAVHVVFANTFSFAGVVGVLLRR